MNRPVFTAIYAPYAVSLVKAKRLLGQSVHCVVLSTPRAKFKREAFGSQIAKKGSSVLRPFWGLLGEYLVFLEAAISNLNFCGDFIPAKCGSAAEAPILIPANGEVGAKANFIPKGPEAARR